MSSQLQDFREQYPQYANVDDEDLAGALHERYYSEMPLETYREQLGLDPVVIDKEPEKPGVWDRISSIWRDEEKKPINQLDPPVSPRVDFEPDDQLREEAKAETDGKYYGPMPGRRYRVQSLELKGVSKEAEARQEPRALLRDQVFAGFDEMRANRATREFFVAADAWKHSDQIAVGKDKPRGAGVSGGFHPGFSGPDLMKQYRERVAQGSLADPDLAAKARADIDFDIGRIRTDQVIRMRKAIQKSQELRTRAAQVPYGKETRDMLEATTFGGAVREFLDDPVMIVAETGLRSLPNMAEAIPLAIAGAVTMGPGGFIAGMGIGSAMTEYRASYVDYLQKQGIDVNDAEAMVAAALDDKLMREAHNYATKRSTIIGTVNALSGGIATKPLTPFIQNVVGRELSNVGSQMVVQGALEGTGEFLAQTAVGEYAPGEIAAEITGSMTQAPIEVGAAAVTGVRANEQQKRMARVESEINEILGRGQHDDQETRIDPGSVVPEPAPEPEVDESEAFQPDADRIDVPRETIEQDNFFQDIDLDDIDDADALVEADQVEYFDQRLKRNFYRTHLQNLVAELTPGGGITYIWEADKIVGRTKSANPEWFQNMNQDPDYRMSVDQLRKAVNKAVTGKRLGVREQRVIQAMNDTLSDERLAQVDYARQELEAARKRRSKRRSLEGMPEDPDQETAGERYNEDEYAVDMTADSRIIFEMMETAIAIGVPEDTLQDLAIKIDDNQELMTALEEVINEQRQQARPAAAKAQPAAPTFADEATADIFGDDTGAAQEIADAIRRRDVERNQGQESIETGDAQDLFSDAQRQTDIDDAGVLAITEPRGRSDTTDISQLQIDRRARIERMTLEEKMAALYQDPMTGLGNRLAFQEEAPLHKWLASVDGDSLKWINDNLGHDAGDAMLVAIAEALDGQPGIDAYRVGGDEFYIGGETKREVQAAITMAEGILAGQAVESPNGKKQGIEVTAGIGRDKASADSRMEIEKKRKKGRAARGEAPSGITLSSKGGKVLDMEPGTNYVPIIGHTGDLPIDANHNYVLGTTGRTLRIPKTPVRREHIIGVLRRYFGNRMYQGRVRGKLRLGFYRPGQGEVRIKNANDIEVAAHEIAHFLDDRMPWIARLYKQHKDEVKSVSYDQKKIYEGWAEFMRLWLTQESEVRKRTPAFYDAFNEEAKKHPKLWGMLTDLQEMMHAWTQQGARARGASKHANVGPSFYEQVRRAFPLNLAQRTLDGLRSIKTIAADLSDHQEAAVTDAYERLRLALGGSNGVIEAAMYYGTPRWRQDGQGIELGGESLMDIFGNYWGNNDVAMYMVARRAAELKTQGRENLLRNDEIAAWLKVADEIPEVEAMFEKYQEFNTRIPDFAEAGGILKPETRAAFQEMNKSYLPFNRVIESQIEGSSVRSGGNPFMRLKGGTQNINNIWDNIINNTGQIIRMSMVNDGKRALLKNFGGTDKLGAGIRNQQAGIYASPIAKESAPVDVHSEQVLRKAVEAMGISWRDYNLAKKTGMYPPGEQGDYLETVVSMIDQMAVGLDAMVTFWQFNQDPKGDDIDFYMDGGEKIFFQINDPNLMDTLRFMGPKGTNWLIGIAGAFSATLRRGVVAVPVFQMKNFMRDSINAWLLSTHVKVPAVRAIRQLFLRMGKDPAYVEMLLNGGGFANRSQGLQAQRKVIVDPTKLTAMYDRFMGRFENANRLAEYKAAREGGESPRRAALLSREISTDFAMRGSSDITRYLAIAVPFLNARAQGLYRVGRLTESRDQIASFALRGLALAGATMALYAINKDDERYKEKPEDIKDLYWVFYTGAGEDDYVLFPKPFESGMIFATLPERMMEYAEQENGKEFADALAWMMLETFHMDMTPQIFQPTQDLRANTNFAGTPIIPWYLENVEPSEQYTYYTSETVREAAGAMGLSPIKVEFMLKGYLGTLGTYALAGADAMYRAATDPEDRPFGEDPTRGDSWKENILVKALIDPLVTEGPPRRTKYVTDLYDMIREVELVANTIKLHQDRQIAALEGYLVDPEKQVQRVLHEPLDNARKQMSTIRLSMDKVRQDTGMTGDEKRVQLWDLTRQRNKVARDAAIAIAEAQQSEQASLEEQQVAAGAQ